MGFEVADQLTKRLLAFGVVLTVGMFSVAYFTVNPRETYVESGDTLYPWSYSSGQLEYDEDAESVEIRVSIEADREFDVYLYKGTGTSWLFALAPPPRIRHAVAGGDDIVWELDGEELNGSDITLLLENLKWGDVEEDDTAIHYSMRTVVVSHRDPLTVPMFWLAPVVVLAYLALAIRVYRRRSKEPMPDEEGHWPPEIADNEDLKVLDQP